ncbi:DNA polymerase beta superfamily protein [Solicola sp. PLA-1-18]|uniref:nucleotidyltransferase domain-containing protein n=1 Tax=Solicola sp. PLA-1-18 TaxID=3380532 RepID=UPI003B7FDAAF
MRALSDDMDAGVVAQVDARLAGVVAEHGVRVPWAIESGSRAWGFPSPDSDYDCRFLYVRPTRDYLTCWPPRDVIETPLDAVLDVNGWDVQKAVQLLLRGNATVTEWLRSPIVYDGDSAFRDGFLALADEVLDRARVGRHYLHLGQLQWSAYNGGDGRFKKFFYALRPAVAVRWLRQHPSSGLPPMDLPTLVAQADVPAAVASEVDDLVAAKAVTRELGEGRVPPALAAFVGDELAASPEVFGDVRTDLTAQRALADDFFRSVLRP